MLTEQQQRELVRLRQKNATYAEGRRMYELYQAGSTKREIAEAEGLSLNTVGYRLRRYEKSYA